MDFAGRATAHRAQLESTSQEPQVEDYRTSESELPPSNIHLSHKHSGEGVMLVDDGYPPYRAPYVAAQPPPSAAVSSAATGTAAPLVSRGIQASGYYAPSGYAAASGYAAPSAYLAKRDFAAPGRYAAAVMGDVQPFMGEKKN